MPAPRLNPLYMRLAMKVARVFPAPLLLTRHLAGRPAFRLQTEVLMPTVTPWPEPNPALAALPEPIRAHSLTPILNREEYGTVPRRSHMQYRACWLCDMSAKKEEHDPLGSFRKEEDGSFRSAEEETNQNGVHKYPHHHRHAPAKGARLPVGQAVLTPERHGAPVVPPLGSIPMVRVGSLAACGADTA